MTRLSSPKTASPEQQASLPGPLPPCQLQRRGTAQSSSLGSTTDLHLAVYNILGQEVAVLHDGKVSAGERTFVWNAEGRASGLYLLRASDGTTDQTRRMILLK